MKRPSAQSLARPARYAAVIVAAVGIFAISQIFPLSTSAVNMFSTYENENTLSPLFTKDGVLVVNESAFAPTVNGTPFFKARAAVGLGGQSPFVFQDQIFSVGVGQVTSFRWTRRPPYFAGTELCTVSSSNFNYVQLSLSPTGIFSWSVPNVSFPGSVGGQTPTIYARGIAPASNIAINLVCPSSATDTAFINVVQASPPPTPTPTPTPSPTPAPTPVTRIVTTWNTIAVQEIKVFTVEVTNTLPNTTSALYISERSAAAVGFSHVLVGFSLSQNGPFTGSLNVPLQANASGKGVTPPIYARGMTESAGPISPSPAIVAAGVSGQTVPAMTPYPITVTPPPVPIVRFRNNDAKLGVGAVDGTNYVQVYYGQPNLVTSVTIDVNANSAVTLGTTPNGPFYNEIQLQLQLDGNGHGRTDVFYVKGQSASVEAWNGIEAAYVHPTNSDEYADSCTYSVTNVVAISMERMPGTSALSSNPNQGGGYRVFPEKLTPYDTNASRRRIKVVARLQAPIRDVHVDFFAYDMDDPSSDSYVLDEHGSAGNDNRGEGFQYIPSLSRLKTDSNGEAYAVYELSRQPGDNWRFAASSRGSDTASTDIYQVTTPDGIVLRDEEGGTVPTTTTASTTRRILATPLLTVWRRLHVELDSMGPVTGNYVSGSVSSVVTGFSTSTANLTIDPYFSTAFTDRRFFGGRVVFFQEDVIGSGISFDVLSNTTARIRVAGSLPESMVGWRFRIYDDDDMNANDSGMLDGDNGEDVPPPNTLWMQDSADIEKNRFAAAYIQPTYDLPGYDASLPFYLNIPQADTSQPYPTDYEYHSIQKFDNIAIRSDTEFWVVYLINAYQTPRHNDGDSHSEYAGISSPRINAVMFQESEIDAYGHLMRQTSDPSYVYSNDMRYTPVHEVGHLFDAQHDDGGFMGKTGRGYFSDLSLAKIRARERPTTGDF